MVGTPPGHGLRPRRVYFPHGRRVHWLRTGPGSCLPRGARGRGSGGAAHHDAAPGAGRRGARARRAGRPAGHPPPQPQAARGRPGFPGPHTRPNPHQATHDAILYRRPKIPHFFSYDVHKTHLSQPVCQRPIMALIASGVPWWGLVFVLFMDLAAKRIKPTGPC